MENLRELVLSALIKNNGMYIVGRYIFVLIALLRKNIKEKLTCLQQFFFTCSHNTNLM